MVNEQRIVEEFMQLVQVDSETGNERAICDVLKNKFQQLGLEVIEDGSQPYTKYGAGNLVATLQGNVANAPTIYFTCHMDTVTPGKGIKPFIQGERIVSDGTTILGSDDKAGLAALLEGIRLLQEQNIPHGTLQFVITIGEESGLVGSRHIDRSLIKAEYGFALDSDGPVGEIIVGAPSQIKLHSVIRGKSAHAGVSPEKGISAIQVASKAVANMPLGRIDFETTANIGSFAGGKATNIVPDYVEVIAEARSRNEDKLAKQVEKMITAFQLAAEKHGAQAEVETETLYPAFQYDENDIVVQKALAAVKRVGREANIGESGGGSDANVFNGYGIPTINLGIGYENIHTTDEAMPIPELLKAAELVVALAQECTKK
ncbi:M20/M25/M40 family metallo-hydrolase [Risungbinella massiliensis]|uniref:M20/M25/M40 family metallo-hydrolase n=1 Tax=Risungbinella massiliensis TaxID=1329796 RepID=UPI0005CC318A|nr:M20/M25/M40 family metallo-hydrolase [Risungbinella massiliensis]